LGFERGERKGLIWGSKAKKSGEKKKPTVEFKGEFEEGPAIVN